MSSPSNSKELMEHLLRSGEHSDVHFLVGDGDQKELFTAHKLILKTASDVFQAMFRFDSKNQKTENDCPVEIPDVDPAAFKVMLSFIYTDDLSGLNGDNAMAVLYAAKKYKVPGLVGPSLEIPISQLRNVFSAYTLADQFELEGFKNHCLRYICQNAKPLLGSEDFLQIDQKLLGVLFDHDQLLIDDELALWKAALRWADEKCRQNDTECSAENRRAVLGPALFKIRFPNVQKEAFSKNVVPSDVLTKDEVIGVYQFFCHPNLRGVSEIYPLKFPTQLRISDWNIPKGNRGTLSMDIEKLSEFVRENMWSSRVSQSVQIMGHPWKIRAKIKTKDGSTEKCLGLWLWCDAPKNDDNWGCKCSATYRIVSEKTKTENYIGKLNDVYFNNKSDNRGFARFITFAELMDPSNGLYNKTEDKVKLAIDLFAEEPKTDKIISDPNKSNGTIEMEIDKVSEFAREVIWSERKSDAIYIKGLPWKIMAQIKTKNESTEKYLGFFLWCDASEDDKNWSCKCSATLRIVSQKDGTADLKYELSEERTFANKTNSCGFSDFISFAELMDPIKGLYNEKEDTVKLAIDFVVNDAKTDN